MSKSQATPSSQHSQQQAFSQKRTSHSSLKSLGKIRKGPSDIALEQADAEEDPSQPKQANDDLAHLVSTAAESEQPSEL